jgi:hypothetical protein
MGKQNQVAVLSLALTAVAACASQPITVAYNPYSLNHFAGG